MSLGTILLIILVLMLIGAVPSWPHSNWDSFDRLAAPLDGAPSLAWRVPCHRL